MKKICRKLSLRRIKTEITKEVLKECEGRDFIVLFDNGKYERTYFKEDLISILEKDHINRIYCLFDLTDKIYVDRDVLINTDNL